MDSYPGDFPFGIMDVVELLHLRIRRRQANSVYVDCPFCGDRRGKMNVNFVKNVWRCNYCDEHGGMLALYARLNNTTTSDAYWEIGEALCNDFHRERPNSGYEMAGNQQAGTGSPVSGTQTDLAGYESPPFSLHNVYLLSNHKFCTYLHLENFVLMYYTAIIESG